MTRILWILQDGARVSPEYDLLTTQALMRRFLRAGDFEQHVCTLSGLGLRAGEVDVRAVHCGAEIMEGGSIDVRSAPARLLRGFDVVFLRVDPPVDARFRQALILLCTLEDRGELVFVNSPRAILDAGTKILAARFAELTPPTRITADPDDALAFVREQGGDAWIAKPLDCAGGAGVYRVAPADARGPIEALCKQYGFVLVQPFLEAVQVDGEIRYLVFDGEICAAWRKHPAPAEFRANLDLGGTVSRVDEATPAAVTRLVQRLQCELPGILFYSADFIGGRLNEINFENPGGMPSADALYGVEHAARIERRLRARLGGRRG